MLDVYRESLPQSYLLIVAGDSHAGAEVPLARALHRASRSGKPAVWVDCSLADGVSAEAAALLLVYADLLPQTGSALVLCHVSEPVRRELASHGGAGLYVAASLLDTSWAAAA